ncbi:MAG: LytTR family DNA-binding domain-containing protein [Bacteroides sp.]
MEIKIARVPEKENERILIECHEVTSQVNAIVKFVEMLQGTISGELDDRQYEIGVNNIFYIESVDNRTFIYTQEKVYVARQRLYELEDTLSDKSFLRISKSVVVNLLKIKSIKPALNGRFSAVLANGEEVIISRKYVPNLKEKIRGGKNR